MNTNAVVTTVACTALHARHLRRSSSCLNSADSGVFSHEETKALRSDAADAWPLSQVPEPQQDARFHFANRGFYTNIGPTFRLDPAPCLVRVALCVLDDIAIALQHAGDLPLECALDADTYKLDSFFQVSGKQIVIGAYSPAPEKVSLDECRNDCTQNKFRWKDFRAVLTAAIQRITQSTAADVTDFMLEDVDGP
ncbi:unnamed protein product, partial [Iphiclides podalirius]